MKIENKEFYAKGKRGIVSKAVVDGKIVLVKEHNPDSDADTISNEAEMLKVLNKHNIGPRFIAFEGNALIREFVDGVRIDEFLEACSLEEAKEVIIQILDQCKVMDSIGINKFEMTHPYKHILIERKGDDIKELKAVMIDFERCKYTNKPKNVTQFCQYLSRPLVEELLTLKGLDYDPEKVKELGMEYKRRGFDKDVFKELIKVFS